MKKLLLTPFFLYFICVGKAQNFRPKSSFGIGTGLQTFTGNNFIAKTYKNKMPIDLDLNINIIQNVGVGIDYKNWNSTLKTTEYVGNSTGGKFNMLGYYLLYYYSINNKWMIVPKVGIGNLWLKNTIQTEAVHNDGKYDYTSKGSTFFIAPEINYFVLRNRLSVFSNIQYLHANLKINASELNGSNYHSTQQLSCILGLRIWK